MRAITPSLGPFLDLHRSLNLKPDRGRGRGRDQGQRQGQGQGRCRSRTSDPNLKLRLTLTLTLTTTLGQRTPLDRQQNFLALQPARAIAHLRDAQRETGSSTHH